MKRKKRLEELLRCDNSTIIKKVTMKTFKLCLNFFQHILTLVLNSFFERNRSQKKCNLLKHFALLASIANENNIYTQDDSL